jgi:omega-6 fatty acid desaturase (delta-12 desaturase)
VIRDHPVLGEIKRMTLWESLKCANLHLWDEGQRALVRFKDVRLNR